MPENLGWLIFIGRKQSEESRVFTQNHYTA